MNSKKIMAALLAGCIVLTAFTGCDLSGRRSSGGRHGSRDDDDDEDFRPSRWTEDAGTDGTETQPTDPAVTETEGTSGTTETAATASTSSPDTAGSSTSGPAPTQTTPAAASNGLWLFPASTPQSLYPSPFFTYVAATEIPYSVNEGDRYYYENCPRFVVSETTAQLYPALTSSLEALSTAFLEDNYSWRNNEAITSVNQDIFIRRSDDQVFSFVSRKTINYEVSNSEGFNYDVSTGRYLTMQDIVADWDALASLLGMASRQEIESSGATFVIEPTAVTFLIPDGEDGTSKKTIIYAGHESVFSMDYSFQPQSYCMDLTDAASMMGYTIDIGCDGVADTFSYEMTTADGIAATGITVTLNGSSASVSDLWAYDLSAKIVCRSEDETYLCIRALGDSDWVNTYVFSLAAGQVTFVGILDGDIVGAPIAVENQYRSPYSDCELIAEGSLISDPYNIYVSERQYFLGTFNVYRLILPFDFCSLQGGPCIASGGTTHEVRTDLETTNYMNGEPATLSAGTVVRIALSDENTGRAIVQDIDTGTTYVIEADNPGGYPATINGITETDLFSNILYAS